MGTLTPMEATGPMDTDTLTLIMASTTARGPLMLSQRPMLMLMPTTDTMVMDWDTTVWATGHTDTDTLTLIMPTTARGPLMLSPLPMLMPTTATTVMVPGPTTATVWATEATTGDKFSASEVQSRSSKRTSLLVI